MNTKIKDILTLIIGLLVLVLVNIVSSFFFQRFDLTEEKRYTLSEESIKILTELEEEVTIKFYLKGDLNAGFIRLQKETIEMMDEFKAYTGGNLVYEMIDPYTLNSDPQKVFNQLAKDGLQPTNVKIKTESGEKDQYLFPGAIIYYQGRKLPVLLLKTETQLPAEVALNKSIEEIEFRLINTLRKLKSPERASIAFLTGHGELEDDQLWDIASGLNEYYKVFDIVADTATESQVKVIQRVNLKVDSNIVDIHALEKFKALIVAKPILDFTEKEIFVLDQFVMNGGRVLWCLDGNLASMDSLETGRMSSAYPNNLMVQNLLIKYGARVNTNLLQDLNCGPVPVFDGYQGNQPKFTRYPWYYDPLIITENEHLITTNLDPIRTNFPSTIDTIPVPGIKKSVILSSSDNTKILKTPVRVSLQTAVKPPTASQYKKGKQTVGVLLEGEFDSYFKNFILPKELTDNKDFPFLKKGVSTKMIVISDGDLIRNEVTKDGRSYPLSVNKFYRDMYYDNKKLLLNAMNYLMDDQDLIPMRSRKIELRLLDKAKIKAEKEYWQIFNLLTPILLIILTGIPLILYRKFKYTR